MGDPPKNWDRPCRGGLHSQSYHPEGPHSRCWAETYSRVLPWLCMDGYRRLLAINLTFNKKVRRGPTTHRHGDITHTDYADESFDAITCLSVVEDGVNVESYFKEMWRILKPGGLLVTWTDYWQTPTETGGLHFYGVPIHHVFTEEEVLNALHLAKRNGFAMTGPITSPVTKTS
jgi:SAM-dependent methyltransferase